jgi:hypothetical protein
MVVSHDLIPRPQALCMLCRLLVCDRHMDGTINMWLRYSISRKYKEKCLLEFPKKNAPFYDS